MACTEVYVYMYRYLLSTIWPHRYPQPEANTVRCAITQWIESRVACTEVYVYMYRYLLSMIWPRPLPEANTVQCAITQWIE